MTAKKMILAAVGLALFACMIFWIGPNTLLEQLARLGWALPILIGMGLVKHVIRTIAWQKALQADDVRLDFRRLLKVRIASQSVAYFSSMGGVVGDPLKCWLLRKRVGIDATIPATFAEAAVYWLSSLSVATIGACVGIALLVNKEATVSLWLTCLTTSGALFFLLFTRTPWLPKLTVLVRRRNTLPTRWLNQLDKAGEFENRIRSFRVRRPVTTVLAFGLDLLVQITMIAEVWIIFAAVGMRPDLAHLFAIEAGSRLVKVATFYVPGRLGADEAGSVASFMALGLDPSTGLTLALARRLQGLVWAAVGMYWLDGARSEKSGGDTPIAVPVSSSALVAPFPTKELSNASACFATQD
jgi:uncharacterized protein (TIRG00374 family)